MARRSDELLHFLCQIPGPVLGVARYHQHAHQHLPFFFRTVGQIGATQCAYDETKPQVDRGVERRERTFRNGAEPDDDRIGLQQADRPRPFEARQIDRLRTRGFAIVAPAGTPAEAINKINAGTNAFLVSEEGKKTVSTYGLQAVGGPPSALKIFIDAELSKGGPIIKKANISF
jgi:hypothetical protein